jgi:predicted DNA-binding protein
MTKHASIELTEATRRMLDRVVEIAGGTPASHAQKAIEQYLEDLEDIRAAEEALDEYNRTGGAGTITLDELSRRLALDD